MNDKRRIDRVCVYCSSSARIAVEYHRGAHRLGQLLADAGVAIVYGGCRHGSMGEVADGALGRGGRVVGILPRFMQDLELAHPGLSELRLVDDMLLRKREMIAGTDAVVALPGGSGTLEELLEAMTLKRLGLYLGAIVLVNARGYYDPLLRMLGRAVDEGFMDPRHRDLWSVVDEVDQVLAAIGAAPAWREEDRAFATVK